MTLRINRVNTLPSVLEGHSLYIVRNQDHSIAELVFTTADGIALKALDYEFVSNLINNESVKKSSIEIVSTIEERDLLELDGDCCVYVHDASSDPEVLKDSALYFYKAQTQEFTLVLCSKVTNWGDIAGAPLSSVEDIDNAVDLQHKHDNEDVISNLEDIDGSLHYKGSVVGNVIFAAIEW